MNANIKNNAYQLSKNLGIFVLGGILSSCATLDSEAIASDEQLLTAAGFKITPVNTPEQQANLNSVQQHTLITQKKDGKVSYVYADAANCKCFYVGSEKENQAYQNLVIQQNLARSYRISAEKAQSAGMNSGIWGPGTGWGFY